MIQNDRTFVPFRALAEAFGAEVAYDEATQAVTAKLNGVEVVMTIGSATYTVNGAEKTADVAPFINGSRTMVPVRFVAEAFGIKVIQLMTRTVLQLTFYSTCNRYSCLRKNARNAADILPVQKTAPVNL